MVNYLISSGLVSIEPYLAHHGIKGMKWGVRRFRNEDGTLTAEGKRRAAKAQLQYMSAVTTANDNVRRREQFVSSARKAYDASRKIDDIREDILDIGRAALGASVRRAERRTTNNSQSRGSHGLIRGGRG